MRLEMAMDYRVGICAIAAGRVMVVGRTEMVCMRGNFSILKGVVRKGNRKALRREVVELGKFRGNERALDSALKRLGTFCSRVMQMRILQHLLHERDMELALPMYKCLIQQGWFKWDATLHARVLVLVALVAHGQCSGHMFLETADDLSNREKEKLGLALIETYAHFGLLSKSLETFQDLQYFAHTSSGRPKYQALLRAYVSSSLPNDGEMVIREMQLRGLDPSVHDYKTLLHGYGSKGYLISMDRIMQEMLDTGKHLDISAFNIMISAYGLADTPDKAIEVLEKMQKIDVPVSVLTWNALSRSCPNLNCLLLNIDSLPTNSTAILSVLRASGLSSKELMVVEKIIGLGLPEAATTWSQEIWDLDLHGLFLATASIFVLLWLQEVRCRYIRGLISPLEVRVITGWGKHSDVEGKSSLRMNTVSLLKGLKSPFRADSQNHGVLVARGCTLKVWLLSIVGACEST